jgi:hypothetical protein
MHLCGRSKLSSAAATFPPSLAALQPERRSRAQALQCLVNILRALVEWYIRAVPSLDARDAPGGPAGEEAPRTDWQPLTSKQSQDLEALAARAARLKGAPPAPGPEAAPGPPAEEGPAAGDGDGDAAGAGAADGGPPAPPDAADAAGTASGAQAHRAALRQHASPAQPCNWPDPRAPDPPHASQPRRSPALRAGPQRAAVLLSAGGHLFWRRASPWRPAGGSPVAGASSGVRGGAAQRARR